MPGPICLECRVEMQCVENDFLVNDPRVGDFPETFNLGDRFQCLSCEKEIAVGFGRGIQAATDRMRQFSRPYVHNKEDTHLLPQKPATLLHSHRDE